MLDLPPGTRSSDALLYARVIRLEAAAVRAESRAIRRKVQEEYDRARYLKAVTREVLRMERLRPVSPSIAFPSTPAGLTGDARRLEIRLKGGA